MGTTLGSLINAVPTTLEGLSGKKIAIDAFNSIHAFLAIIRQPDGSPLVDQNGNVTSHLSGLFYRNLMLMRKGIEIVYVFDGESPKLKRKELEKRKDRRETAKQEWEKARSEGRTEDALKAAKSSTIITTDIVEESKGLLKAIGIPIVQAPSEGEALAAQMVDEGIVWA